MSEQYQFQNDEVIRSELLKTLEYYFSSKNLSKDEYLISQMDQDFYVPIEVIAKFNKIKNLTNDINFIKEIILQSTQLELDPETNTKVRSINGKIGGTFQNKLSKQLPQTPTSTQQRSVLILREVAPEATMEKLIELFDNKEPLCPSCEKCESAGNDSWYVTFSNEDQAQRALQYLKGEVQIFMDRPIKARIKAHAMPRSSTSGIGFSQLSLTPTSTPPPPPVPVNVPLPITPQNNQSFIQPPIYAFIPTPNFNSTTSPSNMNHQINPAQASIIIQAPPNQPVPGYEFSPALYPPSNWQPQQILNNTIPQTGGVYLIDVNHPMNPVSPNNTNQSEDPIKQQNEQNINSSTTPQNSSTNLILSNNNSPKSQQVIQSQSFSSAQNNLKQPTNYVYHPVTASPSNSPALATLPQFANYNPHALPPQAIVQNSNHQFSNTNLPQGHFVIQASVNPHNIQNPNHQQAVNHAINPSGTYIQANNMNQYQFTNSTAGHQNNQNNSQHNSAFYPTINTAGNIPYDQSEQKQFNQALAAPIQLPVPIHLPLHGIPPQAGNLIAANQPHQQQGAPTFAFFYNPAMPGHALAPNQNVIFNPIISNTQLQPQTVSTHNSNQITSNQNTTQQFPSSSSSSSSSPKLNNNQNNTSNNNNQNYHQHQTPQRRSNTESSKPNQNANQNNQKYSGPKQKYNQLSQNSNSSSSIGFNNTNNRNHNHYNSHQNYHHNQNPHYQHSYNNHQNYYDSSSGISTSSALSSQSHTPIPNNNYRNNHGHDQQNYSHQDDLKRNKSPLIINSDLSFPPLNSSSSCGSSSSSSSAAAANNNSKNVTISLQNLPVNKQKNEENQEAPIDPAIISCYKSADFIPDSPTIIKSNTIIDSKSQDSKKATSETLANILNQTNDYKHPNEKHFNHSNNFHQRSKYDSYQRNTSNRNNSSNRNVNSMKKSNDSNRHMRGSNSNQNISTDHHNDQNRRKNYESKQKEMNSANDNSLNNRISLSLNTNEQISYVNSPSAATTPGHSNEEEIVNSLNSCWNKKLTFAEIVQKAGSSASPSPTLMNKLNSPDESQDSMNEFNSSMVQPVIGAD